MKIILFSLLLGASVVIGRAETPRLFRQHSFNAALLAEAVNHFVAEGEAAAVRELMALAPEDGYWWNGEESFSNFLQGGHIDKAERIGWVCQILFQPKGREQLWPMWNFGLPLDLGPQALRPWPLYPVARSGSSYFVLSEGESPFLGGAEMSPRTHIEICRDRGIFRKQPIPVPTRAEAQRDVAALRRSPAWRAINWSKSGGAASEARLWRFIQAQADSPIRN